jgi:transposase
VTDPLQFWSAHLRRWPHGAGTASSVRLVDGSADLVTDGSAALVHAPVVGGASERVGRVRLLAAYAPEAAVVALDLFSGYKTAADALEDTVVVADVFHLVRLALQALDEVQRRRQQQIHGHRGHKDDPLFRLRRVLRVAQERLDEHPLAKVFDRLRAADTDDEVGAAWVAVNLLRRVYQAPDRHAAHRRLVVFYEWAVHVEMDELTRLATTIDRWQDQVLAYFDTRATNAAAESANHEREDQVHPARGPGLPEPRQLRSQDPPPRRPAT